MPFIVLITLKKEMEDYVMVEIISVLVMFGGGYVVGFLRGKGIG